MVSEYLACILLDALLWTEELSDIDCMSHGMAIGYACSVATAVVPRYHSTSYICASSFAISTACGNPPLRVPETQPTTKLNHIDYISCV